jgi:hemolysin III
MIEWLHFREPVSALTHGLWMVLSVPATVLLWQRSRGSLPKQISLLVFGLTLVFCFAGSTLFHSVRQPWQIHFFHTLDHVGIYLLIAGSYTPAAVVILRGWWRWSVLCAAWLLAGLGITLRLLASDIPGVYSTSLYLAMGWGAVFCYFKVASIVSHRAMIPVVLGGVLYSIGAVINLAHGPVLIPGVFEGHELFHVFVMAASFAHFWFMLRYVVPYQPKPASSEIALPLPAAAQPALLPIPADN